jgi:hypothetical protein
MGGQSTTPKVLSFVAQHYSPGDLVARDTIAEGTGLTGEQVAAVMYRAALREDPPIRVEERGYVWRVLGAPEPEEQGDPDAFVGTVVDRAGGHLIIRDQEGYLYLVKRIGLAED